MAKRKASVTGDGNKPQPPDIVVEPDIPELPLVRTDGAAISVFLSGLAPFFRSAKELETRAQNTLVSAKALQPPTNADEDAYIQQFIRTANSGENEITGHWENVCGAFFRVHRLLTSARNRAITAYSEASNIAQRHHNAYTAEQRRIARAAEDAARQAEEARRRAEQEQEAARLEADAVAAEEASPELSHRESTFVRAVYHGMTPERAAQTWKDPKAAAARMMKSAKIQQALEAMKAADAMRQQANAVREQPVHVAVDRVAVDVKKVGIDRKTVSAEVYDAAAFVAAAVGNPELHIPADTLTPSQTALNSYAKSLGEKINEWPGVRYKETIKTI